MDEIDILLARIDQLEIEGRDRWRTIVALILAAGGSVHIDTSTLLETGTVTLKRIDGPERTTYIAAKE